MYYPVYYICMAQPKEPPISLRIPPHFVAEVEAWAAKTGRTRNGAMVWLMAKGLAAENLAEEVEQGLGPASPLIQDLQALATAPARVVRVVDDEGPRFVPISDAPKRYTPPPDTYQPWMRPNPKGSKK